LTHKFDLDILKIVLHIKNEFSKSRLSKVRAETGQTQTHGQMRLDTYHAILTGGNPSPIKLQVHIYRKPSLWLDCPRNGYIIIAFYIATHHIS